VGKVDAVIVAGDIGSYDLNLNNFEKILMLLIDIFGTKELFYVPGNCDPPAALSYSKLGTNIHGRVAQLHEYVIGGIGGSTYTPFHTPLEFSEEEIQRLLSALLPYKPQLLISHVPPYATRLDRVRSGLHVGSRALREFLERCKTVLLCICGHVHESPGIDTLGSVTLVNPGPAAHGRYALIELTPGQVLVKLAHASS